ncbi:RDD family protein [Streptomyces scabichelini]|uniref:RDD family protein n=1 Tax=Streptomyces scabichelini TaxID=2711217 RepID=UPI0030B9E8CB
MPKSRRALAWLIDFALVLALATALAVFTFNRISALVTDLPDLATASGWEILTSRGELVEASEDLGLSLWNKAVLYVEQAFGLLVLATFLYQWVTLAFSKRTLGKALLGLKVAECPPHRAAVRAAVTTTADVGLFALACCLLVEGWFVVSFLCWAVAVAAFLLNALPVLSPTRRSLADRVAGTSVTGFRLAPPPPPAPMPSW